MALFNSSWSDFVLYLTFFKFKQYKDANIANFVFYGKTIGCVQMELLTTNDVEFHLYIMKKIKKKQILFTPLVSSRIKFKSLMLNKHFVHEGKNIKPISQVEFNLTWKPSCQTKIADQMTINRISIQLEELELCFNAISSMI